MKGLSHLACHCMQGLQAGLKILRLQSQQIAVILHAYTHLGPRDEGAVVW